MTGTVAITGTCTSFSLQWKLRSVICSPCTSFSLKWKLRSVICSPCTSTTMQWKLRSVICSPCTSTTMRSFSRCNKWTGCGTIAACINGLGWTGSWAGVHLLTPGAHDGVQRSFFKKYQKRVVWAKIWIAQRVARVKINKTGKYLPPIFNTDCLMDF